MRWANLLLLASALHPTACLLQSSAPRARVVAKSPSSCYLSSTNEEQNLYDILGASPRDSPEVIRKKYASLAKKFHPDVVAKDAKQQHDFADIAAAWSVLSDHKERLRYDRSLQAKEFTSSVENLFDHGIRNAVPFLRKTANTTLAAVETSSNAMQDVGQKLDRARNIFELETKSRELEQQAAREEARAAQMKTQIDTLSKKSHEALDSNSKTTLTSAEAQRILDGFIFTDKKVSSVIPNNKKPTPVDIEGLQNVEKEYNEGLQEKRESYRQVLLAKQKADNAVKVEQRALEKLAEARRAVEEAGQRIKDTAKQREAAENLDKAAASNLDKIESKVNRQVESVRSALRKKETETNQLESIYLKQESARLETVAKSLRTKANELKDQSKKL